MVQGETGEDLGEQHGKCGILEEGVWQQQWPEHNTTRCWGTVLAAVVWWCGGVLLAVVLMCICIMYVLGAINKEIGK